MTRKRPARVMAGFVALGLVVAACGGDDDDAEPADEPAAEEPAEEPADEPADEPAEDEMSEEEPAEEPADDMSEEEMSEEAPADENAFDLSAVCPSPLVIQTDWFPESEHGALYQMVGDDYTIDAEALSVTGSLWAPGPTPTGIEIEVRTGGPAIGFNSPRVQMYTDSSIHIGYSNTESQATAFADAPLISVMAPLEKNPQMIMWDGDVYPDVETIADLGEAGVTINVFGGGGFSDYFVAQGIWTADQVDPSYDGSPARFIAEAGNIAQQGFASAEPYNYENVFEEYGKAPRYQLLHDAGFEVYSQTLAVKPADQPEPNIASLDACLQQFIPIVQQSVIDFTNDPARANALIIDTVATFDSFWVYDEGLAAYSVATMAELGLKGNGPDGTVGNMEAARIQTIIDDGRSAGLDIPEDLTAEDMFTNEYIDESIGF